MEHPEPKLNLHDDAPLNGTPAIVTPLGLAPAPDGTLTIKRIVDRMLKAEAEYERKIDALQKQVRELRWALKDTAEAHDAWRPLYPVAWDVGDIYAQKFALEILERTK
jgi:hypothetical protein